MPKARYVILHHRLGDGEHWDLMIERGDVLATWQLASDPTQDVRATIPALRIGDHRKAYLDYEGLVSGDRGEVRRVESGVCDVLAAGECEWRLCLDGGRLDGEFTLCVAASGGWVFCPSGVDRTTGSPLG